MGLIKSTKAPKHRKGRSGPRGQRQDRILRKCQGRKEPAHQSPRLPSRPGTSSCSSEHWRTTHLRKHQSYRRSHIHIIWTFVSGARPPLGEISLEGWLAPAHNTANDDGTGMRTWPTSLDVSALPWKRSPCLTSMWAGEWLCSVWTRPCPGGWFIPLSQVSRLRGRDVPKDKTALRGGYGLLKS